ncbi:MAG: antitoxin family protein [Defluviitaleaceae bacterium]|nr:antitoxin family protein [Defluviitaleaceae bacterium]
MQAIKAYYDEGAFIPFEPVVIPKGSHAIVTILDFVINQSQDIDELTQEDDDFSVWHKRIKEALALSMDEELPEIYFQRSKEMRPPINFDE